MTARRRRRLACRWLRWFERRRVLDWYRVEAP